MNMILNVVLLRTYQPSVLYSLKCHVLLKTLALLALLIRHQYVSGSRTRISRRIVKTQYGDLRGILIILPSSPIPSNLPKADRRPVEVEAFVGLEYASLLGGELRFMPPTSPVNRWQDVRFTGKFGPVCPQKLPNIKELSKKVTPERIEHLQRLLPFLQTQHEDCLNLNIYSPVLGGERQSQSPLPVVLLIHGEDFLTGTGNAYDGSVLAGYGDIIVITLNYRLGVLGFMSFEGTSSYGNSGLLDIVAALHWIADNIGSFGGDPSSVTLMGQGHGAAIINLLLLSSITKGKKLFKRAILQSGPALGTWSVSDHVTDHTLFIAKHFNCSHVIDAPLMLVHCLNQFTSEELVSLDLPSIKYHSTLAPSLDQVADNSRAIRDILNDPHACDTEFGRTPLLIGVRDDEGHQFMNPGDLKNGISDNRMQKILRTYVQNTFVFHQQKIYDILLHNYNGWDRPRDHYSQLDDVIELIGDGQVVAPSIELAQFHAKCGSQSPTYLYSFSRPGAEPPEVDISNVNTQRPWHRNQGQTQEVISRTFKDDLGFAFGAPLVEGISPFQYNYSDVDRGLSILMIIYWTNFIKTGNPNEFEVPRGRKISPGRLLSAAWSEYNSYKQPYMILGANTKMDYHYKNKMTSLWLELLPSIHRPDAFDPMYHLLDDSNNRTSFEEDGTVQHDLHINRLRQILLSAYSTTNDPIHSHLRDPSKNLSRIGRRGKPSEYLVSTSGLLTVPAGVDMYETATKPQTASNFAKGQSIRVSLMTSATAGFILLVLNLLVFTAACWQWRRLRRATRKQTQIVHKQENHVRFCETNLPSDELENFREIYFDSSKTEEQQQEQDEFFGIKSASDLDYKCATNLQENHIKYPETIARYQKEEECCTEFMPLRGSEAVTDF